MKGNGVSQLVNLAITQQGTPSKATSESCFYLQATKNEKGTSRNYKWWLLSAL